MVVRRANVITCQPTSVHTISYGQTEVNDHAASLGESAVCTLTSPTAVGFFLDRYESASTQIIQDAVLTEKSSFSESAPYTIVQVESSAF